MDPFSHAPKPNTRIPPILFARQKNQKEDKAASARCTKLATLSKQKLSQETSTGDPDLRRCLGHHRLLRRSIQEAQEDMKRYLGEVVEYESDDEDEEDNDDDIIGAPFDDDEEDSQGLFFDGCANAKVHEREIVLLGPRGRAREVDIPRREVPPSTPTETRARSTFVKEKIVDAVRGLMRRHTSPLPLPLHLRAVAAGKQDAGTPSLRQTLQKNNSCSDIPIYIHVHEHVGKGDTFAAGLEKTRTSEMQQAEPLALRVRGRKYAERLGIRRR